MKLLILGVLLAAVLPACAAPLVLRAEEFGAVGDGKTDDGPALQKMLAAAQKHPDAVELRFAPQKTYFLATGQNRYALDIENARQWTIDGGGSLFLVDANLRFLRLRRSFDVTLRRCNVDYVPLPFAEGTIVAKNPEASTIDVRVDDGFGLPPLGGATYKDGEQAYFASLWHEGAYSNAAEAYFTRELLFLNEVSATAAPRVVRLVARNAGDLIRRIEVNRWRASVPVRGVAHRYGPGETCQISGNQNVTLEDVQVWSAPWFAFGITDNDGSVVLRRVAVQPRPGSGRLMSSWRDAFHVKNNAASLLFEECTVQGSGDDAFNIACHTSTVRKVETKQGNGAAAVIVTVRQNFPLRVARWRVGDTLAAYDSQRGADLGQARIAAVRESKAGSEKPPVAPEFEIELAAPLEGLQPGALAWNPATANPNTILRRCRVDTSCRFRSPVTLENCRINALAWFTGDDIEAPIPRNITVRDCVFKLGQGNPQSVVVLDGPRLAGKAPSQPVIFDVNFENNTIWGDFRLGDAARVLLHNNFFADAKRAIVFENVNEVRLRQNRHGTALLQSPEMVQLRRSPEGALRFENLLIQQITPPGKEFYSKKLDYFGIAIKAHADVDDEALREAYRRLELLLQNLPAERAQLAQKGAELHIIGRDQVTSDLPEHRHLKGKIIYDGKFTVDQRTRGLGGLLTSCGEENLLRLENDRYKGRDICVHEFAHNIQDSGTSAAVRAKIRAQFKKSTAAGLWKGAYAATNEHEYFAELTMWYFGTRGDLSMTGPKPADGRAGLRAYDPEGFALLDDFYSGRLAATWAAKSENEP